MEREPEDVIEDMFREAPWRNPEKKRPWAILVDGGKKQLDRILDCIRQYRPNVSLILDFIHVLEYLWKAACAFHAVGRVKAEYWVAKRAVKILRGGVAKVVDGLRQDGIVHQLSFKKRRAVDKCADYLEKYAPMLEYDQYLADGLSFATGVVEGACRRLIKDHMDRTGAQWRLRRAKAVL